MGDEQLQEATDVPAGQVENERQKSVKVVDKRRFARLLGFGAGTDDVPVDEQETAGRALPTYVEELKQRAERAEALGKAEVEAARARLERYYEKQLATARADIAAGLLEVYDNLERALNAPGAAESPLLEGVAATRDIFLRKLEEFGVTPIDAMGEPFDPEVHEAVDETHVNDPALDGRVVEVLQRGFRCEDRLVRPAIVRVGRSSVETADAASTGE